MLGVIFVLIGLFLVYLLRGLLVHIFFLLLGVAGLVAGLILIVIGLGLIFGRRVIKRGFNWRLSAKSAEI